jgi:ADP-dependent NAD(P)H-hydrate dehydratase / NAD(P)H-hydrate epimerase
MKALTAAEMREVDRLTTERFGIASYDLMEAAGTSVADVLLDQCIGNGPEIPIKVCVLCGKGNNGGDGLVVARKLRQQFENVDVLLFAQPAELKGDAARTLRRWGEAGGRVGPILNETDWEKAWSFVAGADVIVDALLGTGIRGAATGVMAKAIEDVNRLSREATAPKPRWIVAVDTPSGLPSDGEPAQGPVIWAHMTVTFTGPKLGQLISKDAACCGRLFVRSIGTPEALVEEVGKGNLRWAGPEEFANLPLVRKEDGHKGKYGHVLVVAGSVGKSGAAVMAGNAGLRGGAGLVTIATAEPTLNVVATAHAEYMTEPLPATFGGEISMEALRGGQFAAALKGKTVLAIGPGLGTAAETREFVRHVVSETDLPIVLDADGLNAIDGKTDALVTKKTRFLAMTPHPGEMARLTGLSTAEVQADRVKVATEAAKKWNAYVLLKGFHTLLASPAGQIFVNTTGNAGLAKGGSGDILTGLLAALIGQFGTDDFLRVLTLGAYLHGAAADLLARKTDVSGMLATEVAAAVPDARRQLLRELRQRG